MGTSRSVRSASSSAATPPYPNSTSGPNDGSWVTPTIVSTPGRGHPLHDAAAHVGAEAAGHRRVRGAHRGGVGEAQRDPADVRLVHEVGRTRLERDGIAELRRRGRGFVGGVHEPGREHRDAEAAEQRRRRRWRPATRHRYRRVAAVPDQVLVDEAAGRGFVDVVEPGHRAGRAAAPVGEVGGPGQCVRGRLGERERRDRAGVRRRRGARRARRRGRGSTRRPAWRPRRRPRARSRAPRPRLRSRAAARTWRAPRRPPGRRARRAARARTAPRSRTRRGRSGCGPTRRRATNARSAACVSRGQLGHVEPGARARVGREDARAAGVADDRDAASGRERLVREHLRGVEQLLERVDADHAGLAEQRVDRDIGRRERGRVRRRGAAAGLGAAALHRDDRLASRDAPGQPGELARVPERLEVEQDDARCSGRSPSAAAGRCRSRRTCCRPRRTRRCRSRARRSGSSARCRARPTATGTRPDRARARPARTSRSSARRVRCSRCRGSSAR